MKCEKGSVKRDYDYLLKTDYLSGYFKINR